MDNLEPDRKRTEPMDLSSVHAAWKVQGSMPTNISEPGPQTSLFFSLPFDIFKHILCFLPEIMPDLLEVSRGLREILLPLFSWENPLQIRNQALGYYFARPSLLGFRLLDDGTWKGTKLCEATFQEFPLEGTWCLIRKPFRKGEAPTGLARRPMVDYGTPNPKLLIHSEHAAWVFSIDRLRFFRVKNQDLWLQTISMTLEELPTEAAGLDDDSQQAFQVIKKAERGENEFTDWWKIPNMNRRD